MDLDGVDAAESNGMGCPLLNWENEGCWEIGGLDGIVLLVWSYGACFSWVGESDLGRGLRTGCLLLDWDAWYE